MVITRLAKQKRHPEIVSLYADGVFILSVHHDTVIRLGLRNGDVISDEAIEKIKASEGFSSARTKALRLLKSRLHSEKELRSKLQKKGYNPSVIEKIIGDLSSIGLIDDDKFARAYIHDTLLKKASGRRMIQKQLAAKGVPGETIKNVLSDLLPENQEESLLTDAASSYINRLRTSRKKITEDKIRNRTVQFLLRRGFAYGQIIKAIKQLFRSNDLWGED
jgi:regulatory protein